MDERKHWIIALSIGIPIIFIIIMYGINEINEIKEINNPTTYSQYYYDSNNKKYDSDDYKNDMNDWYAGQAAGKDYDYDDGGSYYCLGKNDTCNRKTSDPYDLYCSSCDPDGDNVEG